MRMSGWANAFPSRESKDLLAIGQARRTFVVGQTGCLAINPTKGTVFAVVGSFFLKDTGNRKDVLRVQTFWLEQREANTEAKFHSFYGRVRYAG